MPALWCWLWPPHYAHGPGQPHPCYKLSTSDLGRPISATPLHLWGQLLTLFPHYVWAGRSYSAFKTVHHCGYGSIILVLALQRTFFPWNILVRYLVGREHEDEARSGAGPSRRTARTSVPLPGTTCSTNPASTKTTKTSPGEAISACESKTAGEQWLRRRAGFNWSLVDSCLSNILPNMAGAA